MHSHLTYADRPVETTVRRLTPELCLTVGETDVRLGFVETDDPRRFSVVVDGAVHSGWVFRTAEEVHIRMAGETVIFGVAGSSDARTDRHEDEIRADMPGVVVSIDCEPGQVVRNGDKLLVIESMKLQSTIVASRDAVIEAVPVSLNASFERRAVLLTFIPEIRGDVS